MESFTALSLVTEKVFKYFEVQEKTHELFFRGGET